MWDWDDWDKIINLIKPKEKLYARKLQLKEIDKQIANSFIDKYHIQGRCKGNTVNLGLYNNEQQLVQIMTFGKPRYNKKLPVGVITFMYKFRLYYCWWC